MSAVAAVGAYVPAGRLPRALIAAAWGMPAAKGERAVAAGDEDPVTMAVEAGRRALLSGPVEAARVGAVFFATTTAPYREKLGAGLIAAALDLPEETRTVDFGDSLRSGLSALRSAAEAWTPARPTRRWWWPRTAASWRPRRHPSSWRATGPPRSS